MNVTQAICSLEEQLEKLTIADKIFLFRQKIVKISSISSHIRVFHIASGNTRFIVKFSYSGNVQYHRLTSKEAQKLASEISQGSEGC